MANWNCFHHRSMDVCKNTGKKGQDFYSNEFFLCKHASISCTASAWTDPRLLLWLTIAFILIGYKGMNIFPTKIQRKHHKFHKKWCVLAYCLEYAYAKMCKEWSNVGLQDAKNASSVLCTARCALRKTKQARGKPLKLFSLPSLPQTLPKHSPASCYLWMHRRSSKGELEAMSGSFVVLCSNSFTVDVCALHGSQVVFFL